MTAPVDSYTPPNFDGLMRNDTDLGSASLAIIPTSMTQDFAYKHLGIQAGKDADVRIIDLDDMGLTNGPLWTSPSAKARCIVQGVPQGNEVKTQPLVWQNPNDRTVWVDREQRLRHLRLAAHHGRIEQSATVELAGSGLAADRRQPVPHGNDYGGGSPVIANNVLYYASAAGLVAIDPATGNILVTKTDMGISTTAPGIFHKQSPIVVNGRVYVTDENANLWAFEGDDIFNNGFD